MPCYLCNILSLKCFCFLYDNMQSPSSMVLSLFGACWVFLYLYFSVVFLVDNILSSYFAILLLNEFYFSIKK